MSLACLDVRLAALEAAGLYRDPNDSATRSTLEREGLDVLDLSSNDYLGFARHPVSRETPPTSDPPGAAASRLIHGTRPAHRELETALADWTRHPDALLYSSGYAANIGLISALAQSEDHVFSDSLNHASIIDGCRLSRAALSVYPHLDLTHLDALLRATTVSGQRWVVTETYFSMDGDTPNLSHLAELCAHHGAHLILDEAHALGVFGPQGAGLASQHGVTPEVLVATLGKAVGTAGAFIAGSPALRTWLWNCSRSFVYSTAPSPQLTRTTLAHVAAIRAAEDRRTHLAALCRSFQSAARHLRLPLNPALSGPIFPILLGDHQRLNEVVASLRSAGLLVHGIRPPTVPPNTARLRLTLTASLSFTDITRVANALGRACHA